MKAVFFQRIGVSICWGVGVEVNRYICGGWIGDVGGGVKNGDGGKI